MPWIPIGLPSWPKSGALHHLDVELLALGRDVLLDHVEHLPALDDPAIVAAVLLGQLAGIEIEIGLAQDLLEAPAQLRAEPLVGEGEPAVEILAQDHLGQRLDQRVIEDLGLAERPHRAASLVGHGLQVDGEVGMPASSAARARPPWPMISTTSATRKPNDPGGHGPTRRASSKRIR